MGTADPRRPDAFEIIHGQLAGMHCNRTNHMPKTTASQPAPFLRDTSGCEVYLSDEEFRSAFLQQIRDWQLQAVPARFWQRDATLWTGADEAKWMGWLDIVDESLGNLPLFSAFATEVRTEGFTHALLLGMGGSSLGPEVIASVYGTQSGSPQLLVLDSTDPASILAVEARIDMSRTLFIVSSKSGSTLETTQLCHHFLSRVTASSAGKPGRAFIAITDPGSSLEKFAQEKNFRHIFHGIPEIGGRFSVLSSFGMVPAALAGINVESLLKSAGNMRQQCLAEAAVAENPALILGAVLGTAKQLGRDKLTLITPMEYDSFGTWLEQLIAESTGKFGTGIVPIDREQLDAPSCYGNDRVFVQFRPGGNSASAQDELTVALVMAGHPVIRITLTGKEQLGQEFFRWQLATAAACMVLGVNPFDQPDVEASKRQTQALMAGKGKIPALPFRCRDGDIALYADAANWLRLNRDNPETDPQECIEAFLSLPGAGDYFAILAYIEMNAPHRVILASMQRRIRDSLGVAACVEFGPRFLHSTGQLYKGGPNNGVFLQLTCDDAHDLDIEQSSYSFGTLKAAQALGDFSILADRDRRLLGVHLGKDVSSGLEKLGRLIEYGCLQVAGRKS